jgi:hypothetical protein
LQHGIDFLQGCRPGIDYLLQAPRVVSASVITVAEPVASKIARSTVSISGIQYLPFLIAQQTREHI